MPSHRLAIAVGWSPAGGYGWNSWNGESGKVTNSPYGGSASGAATDATCE